MYQLSTDFDQLFDLLLEGKEAVGFVDYENDGSRVFRDVVHIRRFEEFRITLAVRGMIYTSVDPWRQDYCEGSERDQFIAICRKANLEWIEPAQVTTPIAEDPKGMALCQAFLQGAKFWEFEKTGATMWQSDQFAAFKEAIRKLRDGSLGVVPPPDKKILDEVMRHG
jgi:hypothetical protein